MTSKAARIRAKRAQAALQAVCAVTGVVIAAGRPKGGEDWGTGTAAARAGTVVEAVPQDANNRRRRRRLAPWEDPRGLAPKLSHRQRAAAAELHELYAMTQTSPAPSMIFVDRTPDPVLSAVMRAEALTKAAKLWGHIPRACRPVCDHVCGEGLAIRDSIKPFARDGHAADAALALLLVALDLVANEMGI